MTVWRMAVCIGALLAATCGLGVLSACSSTASQLDTLTQAEPGPTRQRAMRRLNLASAYFEQGQSEVAQQEVRAALQIDPQFPEAYSLLGLIHQRDKEPVLAEQSFQQALQLASMPAMRLRGGSHPAQLWLVLVRAKSFCTSPRAVQQRYFTA